MAKKLKLKTHRGAAKRFKRTKAFKRHILTSKDKKSKRHMKGMAIVSPADAHRIKRMLPYA